MKEEDVKEDDEERKTEKDINDDNLDEDLNM